MRRDTSEVLHLKLDSADDVTIVFPVNVASCLKMTNSILLCFDDATMDLDDQISLLYK